MFIVVEVEKKVSLTTNCLVPFACTEIAMNNSSAYTSNLSRQSTEAVLTNQKESIDCTLVLKELGDEKASISVTVLQDFRSSQLAASGSSRYNIMYIYIQIM
jgi:hypothetical protein